MNKVFIGYDTRMPLAFSVAVDSIRKTASKPVDVSPLLLPFLKGAGLYTREIVRKDGVMTDVISGAPMATEFAISRFLVPYLSNYQGWSLFCDSDFLFLDDVNKVFEMADPKYAVMCVKHDYNPAGQVKMDGQVQTNYQKKNWSSFMLFNCLHPANKFLSVGNVNKLAGRDLHRFCWLDEDQIGDLPEVWNWLEGHSHDELNPKAVHFTRGTPDMKGYEDVKYAGIWKQYAKDLELCKQVN
jgi:hypothetical protein